VGDTPIVKDLERFHESACKNATKAQQKHNKALDRGKKRNKSTTKAQQGHNKSATRHFED